MKMQTEAQYTQDLPLPGSDGAVKDLAAAKLFDELGQSVGNLTDYRPSIGSADSAKDMLPSLSLQENYGFTPILFRRRSHLTVPSEETEKKATSFNVGSDLSLHGAGSITEQMLPSGDSMTFARRYQSLLLASGDRISVNAKGNVTMIDASGRVATMTEKTMTPPDMMPSLVLGEFSNGVQMTYAGSINVLTYPDGTRVYLDRTGLRAIDRDDQPRIQLDSRQPNFDFRGFK